MCQHFISEAESWVCALLYCLLWKTFVQPFSWLISHESLWHCPRQQVTVHKCCFRRTDVTAVKCRFQAGDIVSHSKRWQSLDWMTLSQHFFCLKPVGYQDIRSECMLLSIRACPDWWRLHFFFSSNFSSLTFSEQQVVSIMTLFISKLNNFPLSSADSSFSAFLPSTVACACVSIATQRLKLVDAAVVHDSVVKFLANLLSIDLVVMFNLYLWTFLLTLRVCLRYLVCLSPWSNRLLTSTNPQMHV